MTKKKYILKMALAVTMMASFGLRADQVIVDDLIVRGSECVGLDCVNGENFGFDTLRLKENNLRLHFDDTSTSASFPRNDWRILVNDSANGGPERFSVEDVTNSRIPFTIEANARNNALYVDFNRIGFGTNSPAVELHTADGDTPTLRLEQNGTSGFTPQTWDVAGNETNFFIRDATNASRLPFRIRPGALTSSIDIGANGVGINNGTPLRTLHVKSPNVQALRLETTAAANNNVVVDFKDGDGNSWIFGKTSAGFAYNFPGNPGTEMILSETGDLTIIGNLTTAAGAVPDYVFDPDYELMPLEDLKDFVTLERHLPGIQNAKDAGKNGLNMSKMQLGILEKVEELTLYIFQLKDEIDGLKEELDSLKAGN